MNPTIQYLIDQIPSDKDRIINELKVLRNNHLNAGVHPDIFAEALYEFDEYCALSEHAEAHYEEK